MNACVRCTRTYDGYFRWMWLTGDVEIVRVLRVHIHSSFLLACPRRTQPRHKTSHFHPSGGKRRTPTERKNGFSWSNVFSAYRHEERRNRTRKPCMSRIPTLALADTCCLWCRLRLPAGNESGRIRRDMGGRPQAPCAVRVPEHFRHRGDVGQDRAVLELQGRRHAAAFSRRTVSEVEQAVGPTICLAGCRGIFFSVQRFSSYLVKKQTRRASLFPCLQYHPFLSKLDYFVCVEKFPRQPFSMRASPRLPCAVDARPSLPLQV